MRLANIFWGENAQFRFLFIASVLILFTLLGAREIWTQEHRWADIVAGMFSRNDFFHPYLGDQTYYDKPLLSYWLMAMFAAISGELTTWALRLPSALAGLLAIFSIYRLGTQLKDKSFGLMCGWLLLTTFYFIFWARVSSADMLNLAGTLFAVTWYMEKREQPSFFNYAVFFLILAVTALCKGLVGAIVPLIAVFADIMLQGSWKKHLRWPLLLSVLPAGLVYVAPFIASSYVGGEGYSQNGLYLVYRENILRYFQPFDHKGPIYTYFLYLPIYLLPWAIFFIPAVFSLKSRWKNLSLSSRWIVWTLLLLFLFFTLSGSRRSYYVLPLVPFAILLTADWITSHRAFATLNRWSAKLVMGALIILFLLIDILPAWYYDQFGVQRFAALLKEETSKIKPWENWNIVLLDTETKLNFYLQLPPEIKHYGLPGGRDNQTTATLLKAWPVLNHRPDNAIFLSRKRYENALRLLLPNYRVIEITAAPWQISFLEKQYKNAPIAFVPNFLAGMPENNLHL